MWTMILFELIGLSICGSVIFFAWRTHQREEDRKLELRLNYLVDSQVIAAAEAIIKELYAEMEAQGEIL